MIGLFSLGIYRLCLLSIIYSNIDSFCRRSTTALNDNVNDADHALKAIAAEEIDEVDIIMEDINDEIADLQV